MDSLCHYDYCHRRENVSPPKRNRYDLGRQPGLTCISRASRRILLGSLKKLQIDDYIMLFIIVSRLVPPEDSFTPFPVVLVSQLHAMCLLLRQPLYAS